MKLILLGAPGCGKGTQAVYITAKYGLPHVSTGDLFRDNIKNETPIGIKVKEIMRTGELCPDEITVEMVKERLSRPDCEKGYLLDGFPRNLMQAEKLDQFSAPDLVINIEVDLGIVQHRIMGRRVCSACNSSFHTDIIGEAKECPVCHGELFIRKDDRPEIVKERLFVYNKQTAPLIDYYKNQGKLVTIDGGLDIKHVYEEITKVLG